MIDIVQSKFNRPAVLGMPIEIYIQGGRVLYSLTYIPSTYFIWISVLDSIERKKHCASQWGALSVFALLNELSYS